MFCGVLEFYNTGFLRVIWNIWCLLFVPFKSKNWKAELIFLNKFSVADKISLQFNCSVVSDSATPWTAAHQASQPIANFWSLLKIMSIELGRPSSHLILCLLLLLPSIFPSIRVFSSESVFRIRWPKYWSNLQQPLSTSLSWHPVPSLHGK